MVNPSDTALAITAVGQTMMAYQFFLPPFNAARRGTTDADQADVHLGLIAATTVSLGVAVMLSSISGNRTPLYASLLIAVIIAGVYEYATMQGVKL